MIKPCFYILTVFVIIIVIIGLFYTEYIPDRYIETFRLVRRISAVILLALGVIIQRSAYNRKQKNT